MKTALFWKTEKGKIRCSLCPRHCLIEANSLGYCKARKNINGKLVSLAYGKPVSLGVDPIEKKPLYHFYPGSRAFSLGTAGCNLCCFWCQNWQISQKSQPEMKAVDPEKIIKLAKENNCNSIAYTYTEPTIFYEYVLDIAKLAKKAKIKNVIVSNGFIEKEPLEKLCKYIDAANIDLKTIDPKTHLKYTGAWLEPILATLKTLKNKKVWTEVTNLIVPGINDDPKQILKLAKWIKENLGADTPLHFSAFHPAHKLVELEPTSAETVKKARESAMKISLNYVYSGNILDAEGSTTYCPKCKEPVIRRSLFEVMENKVVKGKCPCGEKIAGAWD